jgi:hypothetical protein
MNPEQENFEALRKLLALKRHEIPPPGYFDHLPRRISSRLRAHEDAPTFWEAWAERFRSNASLAYGFGLTACGVLAISIIHTAQIETARVASQPRDLAVSWNASAPPSLAENIVQPSEQDLHVITWRGDTNPAAQAYQLPSLFAHVVQPATLPTAYEAAAP